MTNATAEAVALICRISQDKSGKVEGVRAQEQWGRAYAAERWPGIPVRVYADNDLSAADDTHRPAYERFRVDLAAGLVTHVWAVEQSRLERREAEWFRLAAELDAAGVDELHTRRDGVIRVLDGVAECAAPSSTPGQVRKRKKRIRDKHEYIAAEAARPVRRHGYRHARSTA